MGADFLVSVLTANPKTEIDFALGRQAIEELAGKPLSGWPAEFLDYAGIDLDAKWTNGRRVAQVRAELVHGLKADINLLEAAVQGDRRDVWTGEIGGKSVVLTGGMSWGDGPTEAYEAFERLSLAGVTRVMGFDW